MSTRESLEVLCDTPGCTYTLGYFRSHSESLRKSTKDGWYRDAWTDRCPECVAKMSEVIVPSAKAPMPNIMKLTAPLKAELDRMNSMLALEGAQFIRESFGTLRAKIKDNDISDPDPQCPDSRIVPLDTPTTGGELLATPQDNPFDKSEKHCLNVQCVESATDSTGLEVEDGERSMVGCICAGGTLAGRNSGGNCCVLDGSEAGADCDTNRGG